MFKNFYKNKYNKKFTQLNYSTGVTLIELLVVISIFMVISSITIFSYGKFNSSLSIQNLADDISLSIRKAQGYAIGVRGYSGSFSEGYGVHFSLNSTPSLYGGSNRSFVLFANINNDEKYDYNSSECGNPVAGNECLEVLNITSSDIISEISVVTEGGSQYTINNNGALDIFFKRPNPEPTFCARDNPEGSCNFSSDISSVRISISSINNTEILKIVTISNNGQISVSNI